MINPTLYFSFKGASEDQIVRNMSSLEHADMMCVGKSYA